MTIVDGVRGRVRLKIVSHEHDASEVHALTCWGSSQDCLVVKLLFKSKRSRFLLWWDNGGCTGETVDTVL